ncbi:MAG TPA: hypothetical protein PKC49_14720 [Phycisphaerae bacterium]|nr:hypothetical protein [Phycisphaerae bacterium]
MVKARDNGLVEDLCQLERCIERGLSGRRGAGGLRRALYMELLSVLNGTGRFESIPAQITRTEPLTSRIYRQVNGQSGNALPRAIYESAFFDRPVGDSVRAPWQYVRRLARRLRVEPSHGQTDLADAPTWMKEVDEAHQDLRIWIREPALQDMLLSAMEAYLVPAGSGVPSTEVYGIVFGSQRVTRPARGRSRRESVADINIERVCIQHRAKGSPSEVVADQRSETAQLVLGEQLFPYWHLLGDFHTHTYRSLDELLRQRGWRYSSHDEAANVDWCERLLAMGHRPRLALILAITRAKRSGTACRESWNGNSHVVRVAAGRCHCFIAAYRICPDGSYATDGVALRCPHLFGQQFA